jgi:hypothetical protein
MSDIVPALSGRKCQGSECKKSASFDILGGKGKFCLAHREPGMVNVTNKKCEFESCLTAACFDVAGGNGRYAYYFELSRTPITFSTS